MRNFITYFNKNKLLTLIVLTLCIVPFFWLKPGEMDLGGDGSRVYFYNPEAYLKNYTLYNNLYGIGVIEPYYYNISLVFILSIAKELLYSPYILISLMNSLKLAGSFFSIYLVVRGLIDTKDKKKNTANIAAILSGLLYIFIPTLFGNYDRALLTHNQTFLNPLCFYIILRYILTKSKKYVIVLLIISLIFAQNFSWVAAPALFSFYPLSFLFIFIYVKLIKKKSIPWLGLIISGLLFFALHAFHLLPALISLTGSEGTNNSRVFNSDGIQHVFDYFFGVLPLASLTNNLLLLSSGTYIKYMSWLLPMTVLLGLLKSNSKQKTFLVTMIFFLITFYFVSAKVANVGIELYKNLFFIPGFSMFRDFTGKWFFTHVFFYSILFGQAASILLDNLKPLHKKILIGFITSVIIVNGWPLIKGDPIHSTHVESTVKKTITINTDYETVLQYIRSIDTDSKFLTIPFTDYDYQVFFGQNGNAYVGATTIPQLTGKKDFPGTFRLIPFDIFFFNAVKTGDQQSVKRLLALLNINYIFYNTDERLFNKFTGYPYQYIKQYFPNGHISYKEFIRNIAAKQIFRSGPYLVYRVEEKFFLPHIYTSGTVMAYREESSKGSFLQLYPEEEIARTYMKVEECKKVFSQKGCTSGATISLKQKPKIQVEKVNPTKYKIKLSSIQQPFMLVLSEAFHSKWQLINPKYNNTSLAGRVARATAFVYKESTTGFTHKKASKGKRDIFLGESTFETWGKQEVAKKGHILVNGYANGWLIKPEDIRGGNELILEMGEQRVFYVGLYISIATAILLSVYIIYLLLKRVKLIIIQ